ncbi:MAG: hypothetical protein ACOCUP_02580, partial [bacterium]
RHIPISSLSYPIILPHSPTSFSHLILPPQDSMLQLSLSTGSSTVSSLIHFFPISSHLNYNR